MNAAQQLLIRIGGQAELVAGWMGHYYSDLQTASKSKRQRAGQVGSGKYGRNLMAMFDRQRGDLAARQLTHKQYLARQENKLRLRTLEYFASARFLPPQ